MGGGRDVMVDGGGGGVWGVLAITDNKKIKMVAVSQTIRRLEVQDEEHIADIKKAKTEYASQTIRISRLRTYHRQEDQGGGPLQIIRHSSWRPYRRK